MKTKGPRPTKPTTIDEYLNLLRPDQRAALQNVRKAIHAAAPAVEECISYGVAAFRLNGKFFVGMGATEHHCAFYPGATVQAFGALLKDYETGKGTIRFQPDQPLAASLVRKLVRTRIADHARWK